MNARPATTTPSPPFYLGQKFIFTVNQQVICKGYQGRITNRLIAGHLVEVNLNVGPNSTVIVVVPATYPNVYPAPVEA